jgi:hypothetical protein
VLGGVEAIVPDADASGVVGDEVPLSAFDDAVRLFSPDHILIGLHAGRQSTWQERSLVPRVKQAFGLPVTAIAIDEDGRVSLPQDA